MTEDKSINEEPPQDMVFIRGPGKQLPPEASRPIDWEWDYLELYDPGEDQALPWFDRK